MLSRISLISKQSQKSHSLLLSTYKNQSGLQKFARLMSTDNTDKAQQQDKDEDYDVNDTKEKPNNRPPFQRRQFQRDRDFKGEEQRTPGLFQGQRDFRKREEYEMEETDQFQPFIDEDGVAQYDDLPPRPSQLVEESEETDPEEDRASRWNLEEDHDMSKEEITQRAQVDIEYYNEMQKETQEQVDWHQEEYSSTDYAKVQHELMKLIKERIDSGDRAKAQRFVSQLKTLYESSAKLKIDENTLSKIEELFVNRRVTTDKDFFAAGMREEMLTDEKIKPSLSDYKGTDYIPGKDTFKDEPVPFEDYEQYIVQAMVEANNLEHFHEEDNMEHPAVVIDSEEDEYAIDHVQEEEFFQQVDEKREVVFDSVELADADYAQKLVELQNDYNNPTVILPDAERTFDLILNSIAVESTTLDYRLEQQYAEIMRQKGINHDEKDETNQPLQDLAPSDNQKAEIGQSLQQQHEVQDDFAFEIDDELEVQFHQTRSIMYDNITLRKDLIQNVKQARQTLVQTQGAREKLVSLLRSKDKDHTTHVIPGGLYKFAKSSQESKREQFHTINDLYQKRQFPKNATQIEDYNRELDFLIKLHEFQDSKKKQQTMKLIGSFFNQMKKNHVRPNELTNQRIFEYAVISKNIELANQKLRDLSVNQNDLGNNVVGNQLLKKFYKHSLRTDNFNGLAHLINYVEKQQLDISSWNLSTFQSALSFYLNQQFDLTKLLTFTRYYIYLNDCRVEKALANEFQGQAIDQLTDLQKAELNAYVFAESDSLVDMRSLFSVLVDKVGEKDAVDPFTKQDVLWNLVDFFTKRGMADLMQRGTTNFSSLNERDIAQYFKNHINSAKAFERITNVILRFDGKGDTFQNAMIQILKEYQANNNGGMPFSFDQFKVKNTYDRVVNAQQTFKTHITEKTAEYFLEVFSSLKMWSQIKDLCENFKALTYVNPETSELRQHYLTNALLKSESDQHYHTVISQKVYNGKEELTPDYITGMTKAYLQDGSISHGLKFFQDSIQKMGSMKKSREDYLVSMFDSVFNEEQSKELNYEQFKKKYLQTIMISQQSMKEVQAYATLKDAIQNKSFDQIQNLLKLYLVQSEELQLLKSIRETIDPEIQEEMTLEMLQNTPLEEIGEEFMNADEKERLENVRERLESLRQAVTLEDYNRIMEIKEIMGDQQFELMSGLKDTSADNIQALFNLRSKEEIDEMLAQTQDYYEAAKIMTSEKDMIILDQFHKIVEKKRQDLETLYNPEPLMFQVKEKQSNHQQQEDTTNVIAQTASPLAEEEEDVEEDNTLALNDDNNEVDTLFSDDDINDQEVQQLMRKLRISEQELRAMTHAELGQRLIQFMEKMDIIASVDEEETLSENEEVEDSEAVEGHQQLEGQEEDDGDHYSLEAQEDQTDSDLDEEDLLDVDDDIHDQMDDQQLLDHFQDILEDIKVDLLTAGPEDKNDEDYDDDDDGEDIDINANIDGYENLDDDAFQQKFDELAKSVLDNNDHLITTKEDIEILDVEEDQNEFILTQEDYDELIQDKNFHEEIQEELQEYIGKKINLKQIADKTQYERVDPNVWSLLKSLYSGKTKPNIERVEDTMEQALISNFEMYEDDQIEDPYDETVIAKETHNQTVVDLQEKLIESINRRKKDVLEITIALFNKMQDKKVPMKKLKKLDKIDIKDASSQNINKINNTIDMCQKLLQDSRSPLLSALNTFAQYKEDQIEDDYDNVLSQNGDDLHDAEFDLEFEVLTQKHLISLNEKLQKTTQGLRDLNKKILQEQVKLNNTQQQKENQRRKKEKQQKVTEELEYRIQELYEQYQKRVIGNKNINYASDISREAKLDFLGDLFAAQYNNSFTNNLFPAYYSQDLIIFGLQNNIPEAVRLGEHMMSSNGQKLPREMQIAVREYKLQNADKYRKAIQNTGPIDNTSLYKSVNNQRKKNETPVMMVADDPYWIERSRTTYKRSEAWRRPSIWAYDYKRYGLMSEIAPHYTEDYIKQQTKYIKNMF